MVPGNLRAAIIVVKFYAMKTTFRFLLLTLFLTGAVMPTQSQFLKRLKEHAKEKIKHEAESRAERRIDRGVDKVYDKIEDKIDGKDSPKGDKKQPSEQQEARSGSEASGRAANEAGNTENNAPKDAALNWSRYDFVPGDVVIFEDGPSQDEENGEFPSRWDLVKGQVEIAEVDGEKVMMFISGQPTIVPYLKDSDKDYLPDVFTIEFDFYKPRNGNRISVYLFDDKNQRGLPDYDPSMEIEISTDGAQEHLTEISSDLDEINYSNRANPRWIHVAIAFTKGKLKVYMDQTRVINIPHYPGNPLGLTLQAYWADLGEGQPFYFKNVRIAKGGVKYYDRVMTDGKIVVNGIKFDVNKATLKPESMGPINRIYKLMKKDPSLRFSVEGHTDSEGDADFNQKLSERRAKAVMDKLIAMGIQPDRLRYKGWGESKPVDTNNTPEGRANNRRVEFVRF